MKELLLSLLAVVGLAGVASAATSTFDFTKPATLNPAQPASKDDPSLKKDGSTGNSYADVAAVTFTNRAAKISFTKIDGINSNGVRLYYQSAGAIQLRVYKNYKMIIAGQGANVTGIKVTYNAAHAGYFKTDVGTYTAATDNKSATWSGNAESVVFTPSGNAQINSIEVTTGAADPDFVAEPTFTPAAGTYTSAQSVTIKAAAGCDVFYTTDGTNPTTASTKYTAAIPVDKDMTIKAIAAKDGKTSAVATAAYVIKKEAEGGKVTAELAKAVAAGDYVFYLEGAGVAAPVAEGSAFGYPVFKTAAPANNVLTTDKANVVTLIATEGGYNIKDSFGRYWGIDATHFSISVFSDLSKATNAVWTVALSGNDVKITNVGRPTVYLAVADYQGTKEIKPTDQENQPFFQMWKVTGTADKPEVKAFNSIAEIIAANPADEIIVNFDLTVGFRNAGNIFCTDGKDWIQVYNKNVPAAITTGSKINKGWNSKYENFKNTTPELLPVSAATMTGVDGTFTPAVVKAADINNSLVNAVIMVKDVVLDAATPTGEETDKNAWNFTGKSDNVELSFRNNYKVASVPAGKYDITVVVNIFNNAPSLYVVKFDEAAGIHDIAIDENAPVEYYNLQGVRIDNPAEGQIVIRRQGSKAQKVVF